MLERGRGVISPGEGEVVLSGGFGFISKLRGEENGGAFAIGEHPLGPGTLGAPPHTHENEDEISSVVEGRIGVLRGEEVHEVEAGGYVLKPRGIPTPSGIRVRSRRESSESSPPRASSATSRS